jgi:hypothetical protein
MLSLRLPSPHRSRNTKTVATILLAALLLPQCGRELSREDLARERRERSKAQLTPATGFYVGGIESTPNSFTPAKLIVRTKMAPNATDDAQPRLEALLQIGFFGGVVLSTDNVSYEWSTRHLQASFAKGSGAAVELRAEVSKKGLNDVRLIGPNSGPHPLALTKTKESANGDFGAAATSLEQPVGFSLTTNRTNDALATVLGKNGTAHLWIRRLPQDLPAPQSSDLAILPNLEASMVFSGLGKTSQVSQSATYDPLTGKLEIAFPPATKLVFDRIAVDAGQVTGLPQLPLTAPQSAISGFLTKDSRLYGNIIAINTAGSPLAEPSTTSGENNGQLPPRFFVGAYSPSQNAKLLPVVASLEYLGSTTTNSPDKPFSNFPKMRLKLASCVAGQNFTQTSFELDALDHLAQVATFKPQTNGAAQLELDYGTEWRSLAGRFLSKTSTGGDLSTSDGKMVLRAVESIAGSGCAQVDASLRNESEMRNLANAAGLNLDSLTSSSSNNTPSNPTAGEPYKGFATRGSSKIPISVAFVPRRNPSGGSEDPALQVLLRIGYFGGVSIASEPAFFDWGTGKIVAIFKKSGGANLEFRTTLKDNLLDDATLTGPNLGTLPLRLETASPSPFSEAQEFKLQTTLRPTEGEGAGRAIPGIISVKRLSDDQPSPANMDIPLIPSLEVSLRLDGTAQTPQASRRVIYDPLTGQLDVQFTDSTRMTIRNVTGATAADGSSSMRGEVALASRVVANLDVQLGGSDAELGKLPPSIYVGTYKGSNDGSTFRTVAYFDYLNAAGTNSPEFVFLSFPKLRFNINICSGSDVIAAKTLDLVGYDFLAQIAQLRSIAPNDATQLELHFAEDFSNVSGIFQVSDGGSGSRPGIPQLKLTAAPDSTSHGCEQ